MSSSLNRIRKNIIEAMQSANKQGTSAYDSVAEVRRVEGDTAWVHIAGGVDETPVKLTIAAKAGDMVQVRVGGGRAWITGNASAPPTDDKTAIIAKSLANIAGNRAKTAQKTADQAQIVADSALEGTKENAAQMAQMVIDFNGDIENLQDQIDGNISTWFYDVDPAMDLPPVTDWDTDEKKNAHLGDIYYNTVKGYAWRFMKSGSTYSWERITDTDVTKALADAAKAQDTADSKRRVFYNTPTVPYDAGDLWVQGSGGDILRCAQAKTSTDSYDRNDWVLASKYTDDTKAEQAIGDAANATKVATNYIHSDSTNGLVINNNQTIGVGYDVQLKADGSNTGMNIRQDGNILASFLQNQVSLGKNSINSKVAMCGDKGGVSASFGYYVDSVTSNNAEMGSTLSFDFNETTFKNKVGQTTGFYEFTYTSAGGWKLFDPVNDTSYAVTLSQYGITMKTPTSSIKDHAGITINYVIDGSVKFYNADISNPVRKLELEMAENPSSSESDYANITIERQSGTYASGDGKEHSIITMMTLHEFANVATLQLFDDDISLNATHLYLTSSYGDGAIQLDGDTNINGNLVVQGDNLVSKIQAMLCTAYPETLTVKNGTFTNDGSNASLVGNSLYLHINAKANAAITAGNISNQTMLTITFTDDRILTLYSVSGSGGSSGPNSQMLFTGASSGGQHTITVTLAAIAQNIAKGGVINAKVSIPCVLNWDAY